MPVKKKIVLLPYDFDTAIGINNEGSLVFSYNLEDTDTVDDAEVYNGQDSVLWNNLRKTFARELRTMYRDLRSQGIISYDNVERMFEEHQAKWPAALFNEDSWYKYIDPLRNDGDDSYLSMMQGDKAEQRKWWLNNRFRYIDSKYNAGDALTDVITLRGYAKANISVTPYADIYPTIRYGSYLVSERGSRGNPTLLICPLDRVNDTEIYIYSASQIASVGDLAPLKVGYANFSMATRLQSLKLGDADPEYSNRNLKSLYLGNNTLLRSIDVRNCYALGTDKQKAIDISGCSNIEHVYFDNTAVASVSLPNGGILKTLHLPSTVTDLTILNQKGITDFTIPSTENLTSLRLENVSSVVDSLPILRSLPARSSVRLIGFRWNCESYVEITGLLNLLDTMRGIDERGETVPKAQIYGTIHVPAINTDQIRAIQARYHDITVSADTVSYRVRFYNEGELVHTAIIEGGENCPDPVTAGSIETPYKPSVGRTGYSYTGWDGDLGPVTQDADLHAVYTETHAYELKFFNYDGTLLYTTLVAEGATCPDPVKNNAIEPPTKPSDANYVYSFLGWDGSLVNVRQDRTLTAAYSEIRSYAIVFKNADGTVLWTDYLGYNAIITDPITRGKIETPTMPPNTSGQYDYVYTGWDSLPSGSVTQNRTFTAKYSTIRYFLIYFQEEDGSAIATEKYYRGDTVIDPLTDGRFATPVKESSGDIHYTFWRWSNVEFPLAGITQNWTCKAMFKSDQIWTVLFKNYDGTVLDTQEVPDTGYAEDPVTTGRIGTPLRTSTQQYDYTFSRWSGSLGPIRQDTTITAQFTSQTRSYLVRFYDGETFLRSQTLPYGTKYTYPERIMDGNRLVIAWDPKASHSYADTDLQAVWMNLLTDSWSEIIAAGEDGTYKSKYQVGNMKMLDFGEYGMIPMRLTAFDTKQTSDGDTAKMLWCAFEPLDKKMMLAANSPNVSRFNQFIRKTDQPGYFFEQNVGNYSPHLTTAEFVVSAEEATDVSITTYTGQSTRVGGMHLFINGAYSSAQSGNDGDVVRVVHLEAGESVTVFVQNFVTDSGTQDYSKVTRIIFDADVPLEITKTDNLPFRHPYASGDAQSYGGSDMRVFLEDHVFNSLPSELKQSIKTVVNQQAAYDADQNTMVASYTNDRLWIPSLNELFHSNNASQDGSSRLGEGMWTGKNGFGADDVMVRTFTWKDNTYHGNNYDTRSRSHGGSSGNSAIQGQVFPCFGL